MRRWCEAKEGQSLIFGVSNAVTRSPHFPRRTASLSVNPSPNTPGAFVPVPRSNTALQWARSIPATPNSKAPPSVSRFPARKHPQESASRPVSPPWPRPSQAGRLIARYFRAVSWRRRPGEHGVDVRCAGGRTSNGMVPGMLAFFFFFFVFLGSAGAVSSRAASCSIHRDGRGHMGQMPWESGPLFSNVVANNSITKDRCTQPPIIIRKTNEGATPHGT